MNIKYRQLLVDCRYATIMRPGSPKDYRRVPQPRSGEGSRPRSGRRFTILENRLMPIANANLLKAQQGLPSFHWNELKHRVFGDAEALVHVR